MNNPRQRSSRIDKLYIPTDKHANPSNRSGRPSKEKRILAFRNRKNQDTQTALDNHFAKFHDYATLSFEDFLKTGIALDDNFDSCVLMKFDKLSAVLPVTTKIIKDQKRHITDQIASVKEDQSECYLGLLHEYQVEYEKVSDVARLPLCELVHLQVSTDIVPVSSTNYFNGRISDVNYEKDCVGHNTDHRPYSFSGRSFSSETPIVVPYDQRHDKVLINVPDDGYVKAQPLDVVEHANYDASLDTKGLIIYSGPKSGKKTFLKSLCHNDPLAHNHTYNSKNGAEIEYNLVDFRSNMAIVLTDSLNIPFMAYGFAILPEARHWIRRSNGSDEDYNNLLAVISSSRLIPIFSNLFVSDVIGIRTIPRPDVDEWG